MTFYSAMAHYYDEIFPLLSGKTDFILSLLSREKASKQTCCSGPAAFPALTGGRTTPVRLLDAGCATGSLALELARHGFFMSGIDLDGEMISRASEKAENSDLTCLTEFIQGNILDIGILFGKNRYKALFCLGNTMPHLLSPSDRAQFLDAACGLLENGGILVLQLLNYKKILMQKPEKLEPIETSHIVFTRSYDYDCDKNKANIRFSSGLTLRSSGETIEGTVLLYPLEPRMIQDKLRDAGFSDITFYAGYDKRPFDETKSDVLLCVAYKKQQDSK